MTTFDDRERAEEARFARDEELEFKVHARRNRMLGLWAAELLGLTGDDAAAYARTVIASDMAQSGDEDVYRKVKADFDAKSVDVSEHQLRRTMAEMLETARSEVQP